MINYVIQHHPARAHLLPNFAHLNPTVVEDPDPHGKLRIAWRTYHACMSASLPEARWRVILQDDVEVCPGFLEVLPRALQEVEGHPVTLFVPRTLRQGTVNLYRACNGDYSWCKLELREWVPVVALAWPEEIIPKFLTWAAERRFPPTVNRADDAVVGRFQRETRTQFLATVPSLVEHPDVEPSLVSNYVPKKGRRASCYVGDEALTIDWGQKENILDR